MLRSLFLIPSLLGFLLNAYAQWTTYTTSNSGIPDNSIFDLDVDHSNKVWMATGYGVASFDGTTWAIYDVNNSPIDPNTNNDFGAVFVDAVDHIWIGADGGYLYEFDQMNNWTLQGAGLFGDINAMTQDQNGTIWVAHQFGLRSFDGSTWTDHSSELPTLNVTALEIDDNNELWVGTNQGVVRYDNVSQWTIYDDTNSGLTGNIWVEGFHTGVGTDLWIGTRGGVYLFDRQSSWTKYDESNSGLQDDQVNSIEVDTDSIVWVANDAATISMFDNGIWTHTFLPFNVSFAWVIIIDKDGYKWVGCSNALIKLNAQGGGGIIVTANDKGSRLGDAVHCYPNPSNGDLFVEFYGVSDVVRIDVMNQSGRLMHQAEVRHTDRSTIHLDLRSGYYTLKLVRKNALPLFSKVVIQ